MKKIFFFITLATCYLLHATSVYSTGTAKLFFSPQSATYVIGETFSVTVKVDTGSEKINQVKTVISYSSDTLNFISLSKTGSFVTNWLIENTNTPGLLTFSGGLPTPGTSGTSLTFLTLNFQAKAAGTAGLSFNSGSAVYLDRPGTAQTTNILSLNQSTPADYTINATLEEPTPTLPSSGDLVESASLKETVIFFGFGLLLVMLGLKKFLFAS